MKKVGTFYTGDGNYKYSVISYDSSAGARLDIIPDMKDYRAALTDTCTASIITTNATVYYGDKNLVDTVRRIITKASLFPVPDSTNARFENGAFVVEISKESEDGLIRYYSKTVNGALTKEQYSTEEGSLTYDEYNVYEAFELKPINYNAYVEAYSEEQVTQAKPTEEGYYDFDTLWNMYPEARHVLTDPKNDYVVVESYEQAVERLKIWAASPEKLKTIDIESLDKEWFPGSTNRITGVILGIDEYWSTFFPFIQDAFDYNLPLEFLYQIFNAVCDQPKDVLIIAHNGKFEIEGFLQEFREIIRIDIDTFVLAKLVYPDKWSDHSLKGLSEELNEEKYLELKDIFKGKIRFNVLPKKIVKWYACPDGTNPVKIFKKLMKLLPEDEQALFFQVETKLLKVKAFNEFYGMRLDQDELGIYLPALEGDVEKLKQTFMDMHHTTRNINSNDTMMDILYNKLNITPTVFTSSNMPATSKTAISEAINAGYKLGPENPDAPVPMDILDHAGEVLVKGQDMHDNRYPSLLVYQKYKLQAKQAMDLKRLVGNCYGGFFHFYVNQLGTDTSRQSSDAQQFSATMKKMALPDTPYHHLASCDYHQVELRILFGEAGQEDLFQLACQPEVDLHRAVASKIKKKEVWEISEEERQASKGVNFGVVYMMSEYGMAQRDCGPRYTTEDLNERRNRISSFMNAFPNIKMYLEGNKKTIRDTGQIKTAMGYYRYFPQVLKPDADEATIQKAIRAGNNTPIQGYCATILKMSEIMIFEEFERRGWLKEKDYDGIKRPMARLILPIHDEHLFTFDKEIPIEEICEIFRDCMEFPIEGLPPLYSSPAIIRNWLDAKDDAYEIPLDLRDKAIEDYHKGIITFDDRPYLEILDEFRKKEIDEYLIPLFEEYKTPEEVAKHVRHDGLTHTIIATIPKAKRKKLTHDQRILEGVKAWYEKNETIFEFDREEPVDDDDWGSTYVREDDEGNLIEEVVGEVEDATVLQKLEEEKAIILDKEYSRFVFTMTDLFVDLSQLSEDVCRKINAEMIKRHKDNGDYNVVYVIGNNFHRTDLFVPYDPHYKNLLVV